MFATDSSLNTVLHNAARNGSLWATAFFLSVDAGGRRAAAAGDGPDIPTSGGDRDGVVGDVVGTIHGSAERETSAAREAGDGGGGGGGGGGKTVVPRDPLVASLLHQTDCDGHTALDWACYSGHTAVARLLVEHGLSPFSTDAGGKNCLHWAASQVRTARGREE